MPRHHRAKGTTNIAVGTSIALALLGIPTDASAETTDPSAGCRHPAPIYRNVPRIGTVVGDVSEDPFSYCQPTDDQAYVRSTRPRFDNLGRAWLPVTVVGPHLGERAGWILRRHLDVPVRPLDDAAYVPVRPADG